MTTLRTSLLACAIALAAPLTHAQHQRLIDLAVIDASGARLPTHYARGQHWLAGEPGGVYSLRLRNRTGERLLAVVSIDGVNVISGETASPDQTGYVLEPYASVTIDGWRKNLREAAQFYFTALPDSYAARTDRPFDVGVIGVAVFRELPPPPALSMAPAMPYRERSAEAEAKRQELGTGHGQRVYSPVSYTHFERASSMPEEILSIRYDSHRRLVAMGILPRRWSGGWSGPNPFPGGGFVPDPPRYGRW
jgi:hypothetical protein